MKFNILRELGVAVCFIVLLLLIGIKIKEDAARTFTGRYRVVDGDSLALAKTRFRLLGIDAPELSQTCARKGEQWNCGAEAKQALASFVVDNKVECKGSRTDKYHRLLVTCFGNGIDINREMVLRGMALAFGDYQTEENKARDAHAGLWAGDFVRPGDWRRAHKASMEDEPSHGPSLLERLFGGGT
jgi:endonuclease YncB( thermonuclease family)